MTFPVGFWNYPSIDTMEPDEVKVWADCGMTVTMSPSYEVRPDTVDKLRRMLDECVKYDMKLIMRDPRTAWHGAAKDPEGYRARFKQAYADFGTHPAAYGFFIGDEPAGDEQFADCQTALMIQQQEAPELVGFLNFNPYWPGMEQTHLGGKEFDVWARDFAASSHCRMMCYDCYCQMNPEEDGIDRYFLNLRKFSEAAKAAHVPIWTTLLSVGHFRYRCPNEDDMRWQVSTAVAAGCKGLLWFTFYSNRYRNYRNAPINDQRQKSIVYDWLAQTLLRFKADYGELMMKLELDRCYHLVKNYGGYPLYEAGAHPLIRRAFSDHDVPGMLSVFKDGEGREYIALVNNSPFESDLFKLALEPGTHAINVRENGADEQDMALYHHDAFYREDEGEVQAGVWLAPGQMELFRLER